MATNENVSVTMISQIFTLSYPELLNPKAYKPKGASETKGNPEFSLEGISDKDALTAWDILDRERGEFHKGDAQKRLMKLARDKWGDDFDVIAAVKSKPLFPTCIPVVVVTKYDHSLSVAPRLYPSSAFRALRSSPSSPTVSYICGPATRTLFRHGRYSGSRRSPFWLC